MADPPDGLPIAHANRITQAGFTMIPNAVMLRHDLSPGAKIVYGYMKHLAWRSRTDDTDPPRLAVAADLGLSEKLVTKALQELGDARTDPDDEESPPLVEVRRRGQGRTNSYVIHDPQIDESREAISSFLDGTDRPRPARARSSRGKTDVSSETSNPNTGEGQPEPPEIVKVDGQNLALNALCAATGVDMASPRLQQAIVALNGRLDKRTDKIKDPGIRHLYWIECVRWAEEHDALDRLELLYEDPVAWTRTLAGRIEQKAAKYRSVYEGAAISPKALRDHWLDLTLSQAQRGMSPDEIERFIDG